MRNTGFSTSNLKSPDSTVAHDKGSLLPTSTRASSNSETDSNGDSSSVGKTSGLALSARHLPPVYVDIQEEIEANLDEIASLSKWPRNGAQTASSHRLRPRW